MKSVSQKLSWSRLRSALTRRGNGSVHWRTGVVARCGYEVSEVRETRVGYLTYEDEVQVVAEPFRDTRLR